MAITINTNVASLNAQRNLNASQNALNNAMQRLSSGLRINSAKDDAAGLAITDRMTSQIRGLNQAARNSNDGISLAQTAEGALHESTNILQRMRELAVQSANDTNTAADRASLQAEVSELIEELDRIANNTTFNNQILLDGSIGERMFHVGANAGQTIKFSIDDARASALGANASLTSTSATSHDVGTPLTSANNVLVLNGTTIGVSSDGVSTVSADSSAKAVAAGINDLSSTTGVTAIANATTHSLGTITGDGNGLGAGNFLINGVQITIGSIATGDADGLLTKAINDVSNLTGVTAELDSGSNLILTASDGRNIQLQTNATNDVDVFSNFDVQDTTAKNTVTVGTVTLESNDAIVVGAALVQGTHGIGIGVGTTFVTNTNSMKNVNISTQSGADSAITNIDRAIGQIDISRGKLGAVQNRFESTIANLSNVSENLMAARSRILDADIAEETSAMIKNNILQQAGVSILVQANQAPQMALSLLQ